MKKFWIVAFIISVVFVANSTSLPQTNYTIERMNAMDSCYGEIMNNQIKAMSEDNYIRYGVQGELMRKISSREYFLKTDCINNIIMETDTTKFNRKKWGYNLFKYYEYEKNAILKKLYYSYINKRPLEIKKIIDSLDKMYNYLDSINTYNSAADTIKGIYIPIDIDDSYKHMYDLFSKEQINSFASLSEDRISIEHIGIGLTIRNYWYLWGGSRLQKYFEKLGVDHPDKISTIILSMWYKRLNNEPESIEELINNCKADSTHKNKMKTAIRNIILIFIISTASLSADVRPRINAIYIDQKNVFDSTQADWFFAASILNALHVVTQEYIIADELLLLEGDFLDDDLLYETERNIRSSGLFTDVKIELDSLNEYTYDVYITTRDKWSTMPEILFGTGGNTTTWGGRIREDNLLGTGTEVSVEAVNRSENDIGWQAAARLSKDRLFRSELGLTAMLHSNKFRTDQNLALFKGFRSISDKYSFGIMANSTFGKDFMYSPESSEFELLNVKEKRLSGWFSRAWDNNGRVFATVLLELEDVDRGKTQYQRAFDNSGKFLIAFSSVSEDYESVTNLNRYQKEDLPIGGYGTALLGKIFPIGSQGNSYYYVGAQGERSVMLGDLYLFGQMTGGSAFSGSQGKYTYQEFLGQAFYKFSDNFMLTARLRQQSVWNWLDKDRQLILDNDYGLRGFKANSFSGDNRIITNTELRYFPDISIWIFKLSGVLFYDGGTVWNQETELMKTDWHNSVGFGIRIHNMKSTGETSIFRIDFAFNADEGKFGEIIFTSDQLFPAFKKHVFKLPQIFGLEFDYE